MANSLGVQLAKLIGNHTAAQIDLSWKGSRPVEEHDELYHAAAKAILDLEAFCNSKLDITLEGNEPNDTN